MSGKGQSGGGDNWNSGGNDFTGGFRNFGGNGGGWNNRSNRGWGDRNNQWGNVQSPSPEKQTIQSPEPPQPQQQYQNGGLTVAQPYRAGNDGLTIAPVSRRPQGGGTDAIPPQPQQQETKQMEPWNRAGQDGLTFAQPYRPPQPQQQDGLTFAQPYRPPRPNVYPPATDLGGGQSLVYTDEDQARDSARPQPTTPERKPTYSPYRNSLSQMDTNGFMSLLQQLLGGQSFNQYQTPMSGTNSLYNRYGR